MFDKVFLDIIGNFSHFGVAVFICAMYGVIVTVKNYVDRRLVQQACWTAIAVGLTLYLSAVKPDRFDARKLHYQKLAREMRSLEQNPEPLRISMLEVDTFGYYVNSKMIDLTGLTSKKKEYVSGKNNDFFFQDKPDYCIMFNPPSHYEKSLMNDHRFAEHYTIKRLVNMPNHSTGIAYGAL